jgi:hypothetical protein
LFDEPALSAPAEGGRMGRTVVLRLLLSLNPLRYAYAIHYVIPYAIHAGLAHAAPVAVHSTFLVVKPR